MNLFKTNLFIIMCFQPLTSKTWRVIGSGASVALTRCFLLGHRDLGTNILLLLFLKNFVYLLGGVMNAMSDWIPTIPSMKHKSHELEEQASVVTVVNRWINHLQAPQELLILFAR